MTDIEIGKLSIAEVEAIVSRAAAAISAFKEAQALLGGVAAGGQLVKATPPPANQFTPAEMAEREKMMRQFKHDGLPEEMQRAEKAAPP